MSTVVFDRNTGAASLLVNSPKFGLLKTGIDRDEADKVAEHCWYVTKKKDIDRVYFQTEIIDGTGKRTTKSLHRFIMNASKGTEVDHIDPSNTLDNRKSNLRICTNRQNQMNKRPQKNGSSPYKGVSWKKEQSKWSSRIQANGKLRHLGYFLSELEAARAYDAAALRYFGEFAYPNFPTDAYLDNCRLHICASPNPSQ